MSGQKRNPDAPRRTVPRVPVSPLRHWSGFLLAGATAFIVDSALSMALAWCGVPLLAARLLAITVAMVASWLINRAVTFAADGPPRFAEFLRFAAVAWMAAALNYAIFAALILLWPGWHPVLAIAIASLFAMVLAYAGMRFRVFHQA